MRFTIFVFVWAVGGTALAVDPVTGFDLAPDLGAVQSTLPDHHRVLADGTYDSYTPAEQLAFADELAFAASGIDLSRLSPEQAAEVEAALAAEHRERLRMLDMPAEFVREVAIQRIQDAEHTLSFARKVEETLSNP